MSAGTSVGGTRPFTVISSYKCTTVVTSEVAPEESTTLAFMLVARIGTVRLELVQLSSHTRSLIEHDDVFGTGRRMDDSRGAVDTSGALPLILLHERKNFFIEYDVVRDVNMSRGAMQTLIALVHGTVT